MLIKNVEKLKGAIWSFLFFLRSFCFSSFLFSDYCNGCFISSNGNRGEQSLLAVLFGGLDGTWLSELLEDQSGDGSNNLKLLDNLWSRDVFSEFRDTSKKTFVGGFIDEDSMINFFFCFSLGPFLRWEFNVLCVHPFSEWRLLRFDP